MGAKGEVEQQDGANLPTDCIRSAYFPENGLKTRTRKLAKSFTFRVATTIPWMRAVAATMASALKSSDLPSSYRAHSRKTVPSEGRIV